MVTLSRSRYVPLAALSSQISTVEEFAQVFRCLEQDALEQARLTFALDFDASTDFREQRLRR